MLIRSARAADIGGIALLVGQYWTFESIAGFDAQRTAGLLGKLLDAPERGGCWVVDGGTHLQGYLLAVYLFSLEHGGLMAEIDEFFVTPQLRSSGVGSRLLSGAEGDMKKLGLKHIQLQLGVDNARGRRFYERHGFRSRAGYDILDKRL